jgi:8-oxo-dGTP pyrophosphatase MutT (NUDIX family)
MAPVPRVGGRLLLFDPDDRVVLVEERLDLDGPATEWLIPGGGVEPGESPAQAAVRELYEETGIVVSPGDVAELYTYRRLWSDVERGVEYDQVEHIHVARLASTRAVAPAALTDDERPYVVGARWWALDELRASPERFEPADIADVVARASAAPRMAGRVLLLDDADRVLLVENAVDIGASDTHWITPGGGADPGETPAQTAVRETFEELGVWIELPDDAEPDYTDREVFTFNGRWYDQTNHYYVVRLAPGTRLVAQGVDDIERSVLVGERWWSLAELRDTDTVIYPTGLADVLRRLLYDERAASA